MSDYDDEIEYVESLTEAQEQAQVVEHVVVRARPGARAWVWRDDRLVPATTFRVLHDCGISRHFHYKTVSPE